MGRHRHHPRTQRSYSTPPPKPEYSDPTQLPSTPQLSTPPPRSEVRGARAQHWFDEAAAISERCKRYLPREQRWKMPRQRRHPRTPSAMMHGGTPAEHTANPFCRKCQEKYRTDKHTSLSTCCSENHREDDGQSTDLGLLQHPQTDQMRSVRARQEQAKPRALL